MRRDFTVNAAAINTRWCGDITYIPTWEGWLYLATVIDIASRRVVGFALADHLRTDLVADALANAVAESFFATIKTELLDRQAWPTRARAHKAIFEWIEGWYNPRRLHSTLGHRSPMNYEQLILDEEEEAA